MESFVLRLKLEVFMKAVIYLRLGKADQISEVGNRINALTDLCTSKGMEINKVSTEVGSGTDSERAGYNEVIQMAKEKKVDTIVVDDIGKISRDYTGLYSVLEELHEKGVRICGPNFEYGTQRHEKPIKFSR